LNLTCGNEHNFKNVWWLFRNRAHFGASISFVPTFFHLQQHFGLEHSIIPFNMFTHQGGPMGFVVCHHTLHFDEVLSQHTPHSLKDSNASPKVETMEKGVGVHSLARSTSGVEWVCWRSGMGIMTSDKRVNYSHKLAQTKQQVGKCMIGTFLVHEQTTCIHRFIRLIMART
jgi:hypothetical protein